MEKRLLQHVQEARCNNKYPFQKALNKYGVGNFTSKVLVSGVPPYMVDAFERYWIHYYSSYTEGYNCDTGGKKGRKFILSSLTKQRMSKAKKGVKKPPRSETHRQNHSISKSKAVRCLQTNIIYKNAITAAEATNCHASNIRRVCHGERKSTNKLQWEFI